MVSNSSEDGEEACACVKVERPRSSGNSKKCIVPRDRLSTKGRILIQ